MGAAMSRLFRPRFDPTAEFYVTRPFRCGGVNYAVGERFDKASVETRRLRQIYDTRQLRQEAAEAPLKPAPAVAKAKKAEAPKPRYRPKAA